MFNKITNQYLPILVMASGAALILLSLLGGGRAVSDDLTLKINPANYIMPAAYKVYANPDVLGGRYNLFRAVLKNEGRHTVSNLKVEYRIPKYIDEWTEATAPRYVLPGQSVVAMACPAFDRDITQKNSQSREKAEIRITFGDKKHPEEISESFSFTMMAAQDFAYTDMPATEIASLGDMFENCALAACFVTAEDPVIQYYTSRIQQRLLQGEAAGVANTEEQCVRFMMGIYEATRRSEMVYSSTSGVPSNTGDVATAVQRIRLPRDVVSGNTGLCIELSFLYASVMRNAGMNPVIYLVPGHAFPGFHLNGKYYAIEATGIGGAGIGGTASVEQALQHGMKELEATFQAVQQGREGYYLLDVNALYQAGIIPMELRDDDFARRKIDEYAALWREMPDRSGSGNRYAAATGNRSTGGSGSSAGSGGGSGRGGSSGSGSNSGSGGGGNSGGSGNSGGGSGSSGGSGSGGGSAPGRTKSGLMIGEEMKANYKDAQIFCAQSSKDGFTDWRLPTHAELVSIYSSELSTRFSNAPVRWYWTSTCLDANCKTLRVLNMTNGKNGTAPQRKEVMILCVR
jgi:hypothetical protein